MSTEIHEFLVYCRGRGVKLRVADGKILVWPLSKLHPDDSGFIRDHKSEILAELVALGPQCPGACPGLPEGHCAGCPPRNIYEKKSWCLND